MKTLRHRISEFVMHHVWASLMVMLAVTAFFAWGLRHVELKTIFSDLLPKSHPFVQVYKDHPNFGNPLTVTVTPPKSKGRLALGVLAIRMGWWVG